MRPIVITQTGTGTSAPVVMDIYQDPVSIALGLKISGAATSGIQYTEDDPFASGGWGTATTWLNTPDTAATAASASLVSTFTYPVRGIRLVQASGAGTSTLSIIQAGISSN